MRYVNILQKRPYFKAEKSILESFVILDDYRVIKVHFKIQFLFLQKMYKFFIESSIMIEYNVMARNQELSTFLLSEVGHKLTWFDRK